MRLLLVALAGIASGCLSTTHEIPKQDLHRLVQVAPAERGNRVRVVQKFAGEEPPAAPRVGHDTVVVVGVHGHVDAGPRAVGGGGRPVPRTPAKAVSKEAEWWIVLAAALAVGLAVTEGARYDGWVRLHPMHPVHLYGPGGYMWVPLAQLDPQTAAWAEKAYVREGEGPWTRLGRAPLDRRGWTYSVLLGGARIPSADGQNDPGFMGHIQLGHFFTQPVGLLVDVGLGWRHNEFGETTFDARYGLELQILPLSAGFLHAGGYGQLGFGTLIEDDPAGESGMSGLAGGGALVQLELTTRLTITVRAGVTSVHDELTSDFSVGLSIY